MPTRELRLGEPREGCRAVAAEPRRRALRANPSTATSAALISPAFAHASLCRRVSFGSASHAKAAAGAQLPALHSPRSTGQKFHRGTSPPLQRLRPPRVPRCRSGLLGGFWFRHKACREKGMAGNKRFVYVLRNSDHDSHFYVGLTSDVNARLAYHNAGRCPHTASRRPWQRHVVIEFSEEESAIRFERYLKSGSGRSFAKRHFERVAVRQPPTS
jgi:predicted GIY-YIG superfamily endonuclease